MLGKLSVALLIAASPAIAQEQTPPADSATAEAKPVAYKTKKICRTVEVVGSAVPKTTCRTKKIPIEPPTEEEAVAEANTAPAPDSQR